MKIVKHLVLILAALGLMLASHAAVARHAALLIDADNGDVLYEMEANQAWYPASLTKLMTLYMAFSALESGRLRLNDHMSVSSHAAHQPTSKLGLRHWDSISVEDAILAVVTRSANDAAVVLGERIAGSESQFAIQMTSKAHSLGMYGSHFMNATGLPHDWQTTTAHDMALLAYRIIRDFPQYYPYFRADSLYYGGNYMRSTNKFVAHYPGAEGMKTGYTCGSGYNLVATANQYGKRLIGVILGGKSSSERYDLMFTMMDIGFGDDNGSYHAKNIKTMSKNSFGIPPYQLSCGHRPSSRFSAHHIEGVEDDDHHVRYVKKSAYFKPHLAEKNRPVIPVKEFTRVRIAGKTKTIVRDEPESFHLTKARKTSYSERIKAAKRNDSKTKELLAKNKLSSKQTAVIQTAKALVRGKGYFIPGTSSKKDMRSHSGKSPPVSSSHKPESSRKVVTTSSAKAKGKKSSKK